jgi:hypothetical protein
MKAKCVDVRSRCDKLPRHIRMTIAGCDEQRRGFIPRGLIDVNSRRDKPRHLIRATLCGCEVQLRGAISQAASVEVDERALGFMRRAIRRSPFPHAALDGPTPHVRRTGASGLVRSQAAARGSLFAVAARRRQQRDRLLRG